MARFPYRSNRGDEYIMAVYHYDANTILVEPVKNSPAGSLTDWTILNEKVKKVGVTPKTYIMDNECSEELKQALAKEDI